MPIQKLGSDMPTSAITMQNVSTQLLGFSPAIIPRISPSDRPTARPPAASCSVASACSAIIFVTGSRER